MPVRFYYPLKGQVDPASIARKERALEEYLNVVISEEGSLYLPLAGGTMTGGLTVALLQPTSGGSIHIYDPYSAEYRFVLRASNYSTPNDWYFNDGLGGRSFEWDDSASSFKFYDRVFFTPPGTIAGDWANYLQAGLVVGGASQGVGIDVNEITFGGSDGYINVPSGVFTIDATAMRLNATDLRINDANTLIKEGGGNSVRLSTNSGYIDVGPQNSSFAHIYTDRAAFAFNKDLAFTSGPGVGTASNPFSSAWMTGQIHNSVPYGVCAYRDTDQSISATTWTTLIMNGENYDPGADHSGGVFTVPETGFYIFGCSARVKNGSAAPDGRIAVLCSDGQAYETWFDNDLDTGGVWMSVAGGRYCTASETLTARIYFNSAVAIEEATFWVARQA